MDTQIPVERFENGLVLADLDPYGILKQERLLEKCPLIVQGINGEWE